MTGFSGLGLHLGNLSRLSSAQTRSICPEQTSGEKGMGGMSVDGPAAHSARGLGQGWKISPFVVIEPGATHTLADIQGMGAIQHIWMTLAQGTRRHTILRAFWDGQAHPSIECPVGDFFANGWETFVPVSSLAVCVNPARGFNCYWEMPFRRRAHLTLTNLSEEKIYVYYQITYALTPVPDDAAYLHAQFRRVNPLPYKCVYTILDGVKGRGHYVGTYMAWGANNSGWWGEGEIKFYMDGDKEFPTICGTGTEDYFCGAYNFDVGVLEKEHASAYREFCTPYAGLARTAFTNHKPDSACIDGTSWTRCALKRTCGLPFRPWAGARPSIANTCPCKTTSLRSRFGINLCRRLFSRIFQAAKTWK
jgi:hypothetical protein